MSRPTNESANGAAKRLVLRLDAQIRKATQVVKLLTEWFRIAVAM
jgi:hypothetical protein